MHLIRLLQSGITVLREQRLPVKVEDAERERLLSVRRGEISFEEIDRWRMELQREFEAAYRITKLPDRPDYQAADAFLVRACSSEIWASCMVFNSTNWSGVRLDSNPSVMRTRHE